MNKKIALPVCIWLLLLFAASVSFGQIKVGQNAHVSVAHEDMPHDEVLVRADPNNSKRLIACSMATEQSVLWNIDKPIQWHAVAYISNDGGVTWRLATELRDTAVMAGDPDCAFGPDGSIVFSVAAETITDYAEKARAGVYGYLATRRSTDGGTNWSDWTKAPHSDEVDRPFLVIDNTKSRFRGRCYITGQPMIRSVDGQRQGRAFTLWSSTDGGSSFQYDLERIGVGGLPVVFNPWNPVVMSDGTLVMQTIDLSGSCKPGDGECEQKTKTRALWVITSSDGGESIDGSYKVVDIDVSNEKWRAPRPPCVLAVDTSGGPFHDRLYMAWSERVEGRQIIRLSFSLDKGYTWSKPIDVNDDRAFPRPQEGPDDFMPSLAVNGKGVVGITWYDRRDNPDNKGYWVRFSASLDGGETWLPSVRVSEKPKTYLGGEKPTIATDVHREPVAGSSAATPDRLRVNVARREWLESGHTAGLTADADGTFHALWVDNRTGIDQVFTAPIDVTGLAFKNGSPELAPLTNVTKDVSIEIVGSTYDDKKQTLSVVIRIKNDGKVPLAPLKARCVRMTSFYAVPSIANADDGKSSVGAVWNLSASKEVGVLPPGETSADKTLLFKLNDVRPLGFVVNGAQQAPNLVDFDLEILASPRQVQN